MRDPFPPFSARLGRVLVLFASGCAPGTADTPDAGAFVEAPLCGYDPSFPCIVDVDPRCPATTPPEGAPCEPLPVGCDYCPGDPADGWTVADCFEGTWTLHKVTCGG